LRALIAGIIGMCLRLIIRIIAKADTLEFRNIPDTGPLIIVFNHVNYLEVPLLYLRLRPRSVHYLAKKETWDKPFRAWMADRWGSVNVDRGGNPLGALKQAGALLDEGRILLVSPEGTRSEDGVLRNARCGVVLLALEHQATILPVAHTGAEVINQNLKRLRRTRVRYHVGRPFRLVGEGHPKKPVREGMLQAVMGELAALLPEHQRGIYGDGVVDETILEYL